MEGEAGCLSLDLLNLLGETYCVGVPDCLAVLQGWSYEGLIRLFLHLWVANVDISSQEVESVGCLGRDVVNMSIPSQVTGDC